MPKPSALTEVTAFARLAALSALLFQSAKCLLAVLARTDTHSRRRRPGNQRANNPGCSHDARVAAQRVGVDAAAVSRDPHYVRTIRVVAAASTRATSTRATNQVDPRPRRKMSSTTESTLRYGRQGGSRRVVFGHGVGGLDLYANTFIRDMVERWSKDPRLSHIEFVVPIAPTRSVGLTGGAEVPAWFDCEKEESAKSVWNVDGWKVNREHLEDSMRAYVDYATRDGGALETTVFAGFSNGGAQAIFSVEIKLVRQLGGPVGRRSPGRRWGPGPGR